MFSMDQNHINKLPISLNSTQVKLSKNCSITRSLSGFSKEDFLGEEVKYTALRVPIEKINLFQQQLTDYLLQEPGLDNPQKDQSFNMRLLLLQSNINIDIKQLPEEKQNWIHNEKVQIIQFPYKKQYSTYSLEDSLRRILPTQVQQVIPKVETIKDFKILELTQSQLPFKSQIAEIYFDKSNFVKTILNKIQIDTQTNKVFRYFLQYKYEYLFGRNNSEVEFFENNCKFNIDLTHAYCDISLQDEREQLLAGLNKDDVACDLLGDILLDVKIAKERGNFIMNLKEQSNQFTLHLLNCLQNNRITDSKYLAVWTDLLDVLKLLFSISYFDQRYCKHLILPYFMDDLTFLSLFVGLFSLIKPNNHFLESADNLPIIHFYPLVNLSDIPEEQDIKNYIIEKLNKFINTQLKQEVNLFQVQDIKQFRAPPHTIDSKKLIFLQLQLSQQVLNYTTPLFHNVICVKEGTATGLKEISILQKRQRSLLDNSQDFLETELHTNPVKKVF